MQEPVIARNGQMGSFSSGFFFRRARAWITWELGMMLFAVESYPPFNVMSVDLCEISKIWIVIEANRVWPYDRRKTILSHDQNIGWDDTRRRQRGERARAGATKSSQTLQQQIPHSLLGGGMLDGDTEKYTRTSNPRRRNASQIPQPHSVTKHKCLC